MFKKHTLLMTILIACLALGNCEDVQKPVENTNPEAVDGSELIDIKETVENTNQATVATLTQLRVKASNSTDATNTYKCTVGSHPSSRLACTAHDSNRWPRPHDIELKLRCPRSGSGVTLSYVEIIYSVTSSNVNCHVNEGSVGLGYIGITVNARNTMVFNYSARFYTY